VGQLWETLISTFRRMRIRMGDVGWAAVQPARSKLHAGRLRFARWRRRRAEALWYAGASVRASWQGASGRRRATVGVLAVLPFAMASGVTAMVLPAGGDPRAGAPAVERAVADAPSKQGDQKATAAAASSRAERPKPAREATRGPGAGSAPVAAGPAAARDAGPAAARDAGSLDGGSDHGGSRGGGSGGGDSAGGHSLGGDGGDSPAQERAGSRGGERHTPAAPAPPARTRRLPAGGSDERFRPSPGPPAAKAPAPQTEAPAVPAPEAAPPATEPAPVIEPDADFEGDSGNDEGDGPGNSDRRGPPPDRGGGNDQDQDEDDDD
jgi:hypothetical protein